MKAPEQRRVGRLLATGATGFVGRHVAAMVDAGEFGDDAVLVPAPEGFDVRSPEAVVELVASSRPDSVMHLAAQSFVPRSFEDPRETFEINLIGTLNLLQALDASGFAGRLLYVSSGDVYGRVPEDELPVDESRVPEPRSPYAASKVAAEQLCLAWQRAKGLDVVIARPFNHVGPGQGAHFVVPALAAQVVAIAGGLRPPHIDAGDIDVTRDFSDVRDIVRAYAALLKSGHAGTVYTIGSGEERSVRSILENLCRLCGISPEVRQDKGKLRPAEQRRMVASSELLRRHTGYSPRVPFEQTLTDILEDARKNP